MKAENTNQTIKDSEQPKDKIQGGMKGYIVAGLILLFCIPLFYLFYVNSQKPGKKEAPQLQSQTPVQPQNPVNDLAVLEATLVNQPTFQNHINYGIALQKNHLYRKSIPVFQKAIELNPGSAISYNNVAVAYIITKDFKEAEMALKKAIELDPEFQLAKNNLIWMEDERKKFVSELQRLESIPDVQKSSKECLDLGLLYYGAKEYEKSVNVLLKCIEKDPTNPAAFNNLGTSYMFLRNFEEAKKAFNKAIELDGKEQLYKNNLKWAENPDL